MSCSSKMPLPRALDTADGASRNLAIVDARVQSSAKKSALQVISPWAARYCSTDFWRNRPGIRKKGDTACGSPMASRNDAKPSSISRAAESQTFCERGGFGVVGYGVALVVTRRPIHG